MQFRMFVCVCFCLQFYIFSEVLNFSMNQMNQLALLGALLSSIIYCRCYLFFHIHFMEIQKRNNTHEKRREEKKSHQTIAVYETFYKS